MSKEELIQIFEEVRDIPYRIPLVWEEEDDCCSGKHEKLYNILKEKGYNVRLRVCLFYWSKTLKMPEWLVAIPHDDDSTHTFLEINLGDGWIVMDATWDSALRNKFKINEFDGENSTEIGVEIDKLFSVEKSLEIVNNQDEELITSDLVKNGEFYKGFNKWLEEIRNQ